MIKKMIIFILVTHCVISFSAEIEISHLLVTGHTFSKNKDFQNKIDKKGILMYNPVLSLKYNNYNLMGGKDSINSTIVGLFYSKYLEKYDVSWLLGFYTNDISDWDHIYNNHQLKVSSDLAFIPIIGIKKHWCKHNTCLTTVLTPATFSFGYTYKFH